MLAARDSFSIVRCGVLLTPGVAKVTLSGLALVRVISSPRLETGKLLLAMSRNGKRTSSDTATNCDGSKPSLLYTCWLIASGPGGETRSVYPSGGDLNTISVPRFDAAPGLFSTITG